MTQPKDSLARARATKTNFKPGVTPVLILCDNSGSMQDYVDTMNKCILDLIEDLKSAPVLANKIELAIMSFNTKCVEILPFTRVSNINICDIKKIEPEEWATYLGMALNESVEMLANEKEQFKKAKTDYTQPNLIVLSDGEPEYEDESVTNAGVRAIQNKIRNERWNCIPIFIGNNNGVEPKIMKDICVPDASGKRDYIKFDSSDKGADIVEAFKFASMSIGAVGENADGPMANPMSSSELKERILRNRKQRKSFADRMKF